MWGKGAGITDKQCDSKVWYHTRVRLKIRPEATSSEILDMIENYN